MKKLAIIYGQNVGDMQRLAVKQLTEILLDHTMEYPVCVEYGSSMDVSDFLCMYVGTRESHPYIREHGGRQPVHPEGYAISVKNGEVIIEGGGDAGVIYGVMDFYNKYLLKLEYPHHPGLFVLPVFEKDLPDFELSSEPKIKDRGLWTWGHVIYDYRGYIDNMMKLKLNTLIMWNDFAPMNAKEIIEYAHERNIRVIWGFAWAWDTNCLAFDVDKVKASRGEILEKFEKEYGDLSVDGIYFQSFTEVNVEYIGGKLIAEAVTEFVNETAALFFEKYPDMEIQFGLHAESVRNRLEYLKKVDPRIRIVWENCGAFPFSYIPKDVENFDETCGFVREIAHLRGENERFGAVTKGLVKLNWSEFKHLEGPQYIGVSSDWMAKNRIERKHKIWKYIQAYWLAYADKAQEMVRLMQQEKQGDLCVTALVEDGMFEKEIMYPAALYAEMLWDAEADIKETLSMVALREYVTFA